MFIRQICLVARELDSTVADLCGLLGIDYFFRDPEIHAIGLHNAVMPIGNTFLEVVSPTQKNTTAGRYLDRRGGDGGYMVILQTQDIEGDRKRVKDLGVRLVGGAKHNDMSTMQLHPRDVGGAIVEIGQPDPPDSWRWAGPEWITNMRTDVTEAILGAVVQAKDPGAMAERWSQVLGRECNKIRDNNKIKEGFHRINLDNGTFIRFQPETDGRGEGVSGLEVRVKDKLKFLARAKDRGFPTKNESVLLAGISIQPTV